eukprot:CAMPEP_0196680752 /NCGR_PEP_ID=MMETSP1090-20130531/8021_1 /TAXON_ID=37098 /ORGANISM="Isochrysis sp, Strain CCMP1244" /LENGTH=180 /DNA_ID=CAMNT_0042019073 /DNA_START=61 /DNA_END=604 /DNA_ORIENTATION=+
MTHSQCQRASGPVPSVVQKRTCARNKNTHRKRYKPGACTSLSICSIKSRSATVRSTLCLASAYAARAASSLLQREHHLLAPLHELGHVERAAPRIAVCAERELAHCGEGSVDAVERRLLCDSDRGVASLWCHAAEDLARRVDVARPALLVYACVGRPLALQPPKRCVGVSDLLNRLANIV